MRYFACVYFSIVSFVGNAQNAPGKTKIDNNLSAVFPFDYSLKETDSSKVYNCMGESLEFIIDRKLSKVIDRSRQEFNTSLDSYRRMIDREVFAQWYTKIYADTIIGGTHGLFVSLKNESSGLPTNRIYIFYTTRDSLTYTVFANFFGAVTPANENKVEAFYKGLQFAGDYYSSLPDKTGRNYGLVGTLVGWTSLLTVLSYLVYSMAKRKTVI